MARQVRYSTQSGKNNNGIAMIAMDIVKDIIRYLAEVVVEFINYEEARVPRISDRLE